MKREQKKLVFNWAWIITAITFTVFFVIALFVYIKCTPKNVSDILKRNESSTEQLTNTLGDLEISPHITKVYEYETDKTTLEIDYIKSDRYDMEYVIIEDPSLSCAVKVECFVFSDIADKETSKSIWNMTVEETEKLTLTETRPFSRIRVEEGFFKDMKKDFCSYFMTYRTFVRVTVKNGVDGVIFTNIDPVDNDIYG